MECTIPENKQKSVLILDSGIGGMTVVRAIRQQKADLSIRYISDNSFFPYGALAEETLVVRVHQLVGQALERFAVDAVVIACNTASTVVLEPLRTAYAVPFIGVVPPIRTAAEISISRVIGLLATQGTVRRTYIDELISKFAPDCTVVRVDCPDLASMAEEKARGHPVDRERLNDVVESLRTPGLQHMDVVVLGCTHYPIMQSELKAAFRPDIVWLNPAWPVARQVMRVLYGEGTRTRPVGSATSQMTSQVGNDALYVTRENWDGTDLQPFLKEFGLRNTRNNGTAVVDVWK